MKRGKIILSLFLVFGLVIGLAPVVDPPVQAAPSLSQVVVTAGLEAPVVGNYPQAPTVTVQPSSVHLNSGSCVWEKYDPSTRKYSFYSFGKPITSGTYRYSFHFYVYKHEAVPANPLTVVLNGKSYSATASEGTANGYAAYYFSVDSVDYTARTLPSISGSVTVDGLKTPMYTGQTVSARLGGSLAGMDASRIHYQWQGRHGAGGEAFNISKATEKEYWLSHDLGGSEVRVMVTAEGYSGNVTSNWFAATLCPFFSVNVQGGTASKSTARAGEYINLTPQEKEGQTFARWMVTSGNPIFYEPLTTKYLHFQMPAEDVSIKAVFDLNPTHVTTGAVNVRKDPDEYSARIGGLTSGKPVTVVQTQGEWSRIAYGTGFGWVMSRYLKPIGSAETYSVTVNGGTANPKEAAKGETVQIIYLPTSGYGPDGKACKIVLDHWEVTSGNVTLADPKADSTTFVMPAGNVSIKAVTKVQEENPKTNPFEDVFETDEYYDAVIWAYYAEPQVTNGMDATHFGPKRTVTRGQAVTFLWRAMGKPKPFSQENPFKDVKSDDYYYEPVLWAVEKGITNGTSATTFSPDETLTTAHMITFLYRAGNPKTDETYGWYETAAAWAGNGYGGKPFGVNTVVNNTTNCPRAYVVMFLQKAK